MYRTRHGLRNKGFALPTVLIASVVLLTVLAVSVSSTATVRTTLKNQYYAQLAQVAGEAGVAYAKACLAANGNVPLWSSAKPLTPATDCSGNLLLGAQVKALVVAGGGSGGGSTGGGGGAGGVIYNEEVAITATNYPITVGAGGAGVGQQTVGNNGANSTFNGITATGGGGGGWSGPSAGGGGKNGGSGGGGQNYYGSYPSGTGIAGQGFAGGNVALSAGSGGGGAGAVGGTPQSSTVGGVGGIGVANAISGTLLYYGGGGGGGNGGAGGAGGGANSVYGNGGIGQAGVANTGGGGSGGWDHSGGTGGAGGSGVVIISHPVNSGTNATVSGAGNTRTVSGSNVVYKFITSGSLNVTAASSGSCPTDPRCSVTVNGNVRSSFTIGTPSIDANGKAVSIPNNGYVDILRASNGSVWRTYRQPAVQVSVVPDLCTAATTSAQGWSNAVRSATQDNFAPLPSAQSISLSAGTVNTGQIYFRKDFAITSAGNYKLDLSTGDAADRAEMFVNGNKVATSQGSLASGSTYFDIGCQSVVVELTNNTVIPKTTRFTASIQKQTGGGNAIGTDSSWRVSTGTTAHFSSTNFFAAPSVWKPIRKYNQPGWANNLAMEGITTPAASGVGYAFFIDKRTVTVATDTPVRATFACTFSCQLYLDGKLVGLGNPSVETNYNFTLTPGSHKFAMKQYGNGANPYFWFSALRTADNAVLSQSDLNWVTSDTYFPDQEIYSYDANFIPQPNQFGSGTVSVLVVGGGGGGGSDMGGGGGGGGVVTNTSYTATGIVDVVVGNGGNGSAGSANKERGYNGGDSSFGRVVAIGGGGGGSNYAVNTSPPSSGGSGGGNAAYLNTTGSVGIIGQGFKGGATTGAYWPGGGGGAGGVGTTGAAGQPAHGGIGVANNILGTNYYWGGGGGGSGYTTIGGNGGNGGGGGGAVGTTTGGAGFNAGSPGGGGTTVAQTNRPGGNAGANTGGGGGGGSHYDSNNYGGNGGSGIVIVSYPTTSGLSASGGTVTINGANTVHTFTSSGQFVIGRTTSVDALVVAGGGGGGANHGGGGGGGGVIVTSATKVTTQQYAVTVGNGGNGGAGVATGGNGGNSSFNGIAAVGGGGGGARITTSVVSVPTVGGSGGGGAGTIDGTTGAVAVGRPGIPGQGNAGGNGSSDATAGQGGGGGGAGVAGGNGSGAASTGISGTGGNGLLVAFAGVSSYYGGGGSGGRWAAGSVGAGGLGGGGTGGATPAGGTSGTPNTGGGGGGSGNAGGGAGGSGSVSIAYTTGTMYATGGTIMVIGNKTIHTFSSSGVFTVTSIP